MIVTMYMKHYFNIYDLNAHLMSVLTAFLPGGLYPFMPITEGTALPFESEWVLYPAFGFPPAPTAHPTPLPPAHPL